MLDSVSQKVVSSQNVSKKNTYTSFREDSSSQGENSLVENINKNKTNIFAAGLITGGAILMYMGLARPGKFELFNRYINSRIESMEGIAEKYSDFVRDKIRTSFRAASDFISEYKKNHILDASGYLTQINVAPDAQRAVKAQDMAFDTIYNLNKKNSYTASDIGEFSSRFTRIKYDVSRKIYKQRNRAQLELSDYVILPQKDAGKIGEDLMEGGGERLKNIRDNLVEYIGRVFDTHISSTARVQYKQMAEAIVEGRASATQTKELVLETAFEKVRQLLNLGEDFVPMYKTEKYDLSQVKNLSGYLKPQVIGQDILKAFDDDRYIMMGLNADLTKPNKLFLRDMFYGSSKDYNLKDLRYLIDRVRLHGAVAEAAPETKAQAKVYDKIALKLEYLSNILNDYGKAELMKYCKCDFSKLNVEQRRARLYYIGNAARRLGFEDFSAMHEYLMKNSDIYKDLDLAKYSKIIEADPEAYFAF